MIKNDNMHSSHHCANYCNNCNERMSFLRALDFAIQETVLYLDAYPHCQAALDYYHKLMEQRAEAMEAYEKHCAPLTMYGNKSHTSWDWIKGPWPWEFDAN